jgi:Tfp pilus assembly protein PilO
VCVFVLFWYLPLRERTKAIKQTKTAQTLAIAKGTADSKQLPLLGEQLLKLQTELGDYEANIPEQRALGVFLHRIADLMNEHDLKEQVIAPGEEVKADKFNCIPVSMQCKGKLAQLSEFHRRLQALDRLVRIEQVKLSNDSNYNGELSMATEVVVYYRTKVGRG